MTEERKFECTEPGCDASFTLARGLQRHLHETHGHPSYKDRLATGEAKRGEPSSMNGGDPAMSEPVHDERLESLAAPLRASIADDEARLVEIENEKQEITARIRPVKAAINALLKEHAKPGPKQKFSGRGPGDRVGQGAKQVSESAIEVLSRVMVQHSDELGNEFDAKRLQEVLRAHGGTMNLSDQRRVMRVMHERGMLRLMSANGTGGRKTYSWVREPEAVT